MIHTYNLKQMVMNKLERFIDAVLFTDGKFVRIVECVILIASLGYFGYQVAASLILRQPA